MDFYYDFLKSSRKKVREKEILVNEAIESDDIPLAKKLMDDCNSLVLFSILRVREKISELEIEANSSCDSLRYMYIKGLIHSLNNLYEEECNDMINMHIFQVQERLTYLAGDN